MHSIHISERYNRNLILATGLKPSKVLLDQHLQSFHQLGYLPKNENKMLYMWQDSEKNAKFVKDMAYCKTWISPRNKLCSYSNPDQWPDFSKIVMDKLYPYKDMIYDIYAIKNPFYVNNFELHTQEPSENKQNSCYGMDDRYAHDDKVLILSRSIESDIKIVGQAVMHIDKRNKINIKIIKNPRY